jgi:hypothetical protein
LRPEVEAERHGEHVRRQRFVETAEIAVDPLIAIGRHQRELVGHADLHARLAMPGDGGVAVPEIVLGLEAGEAEPGADIGREAVAERHVEIGAAGEAHDVDVGLDAGAALAFGQGVAELALEPDIGKVVADLAAEGEPGIELDIDRAVDRADIVIVGSTGEQAAIEAVGARRSGGRQHQQQGGDGGQSETGGEPAVVGQSEPHGASPGH